MSQDPEQNPDYDAELDDPDDETTGYEGENGQDLEDESP